MLYVTTLNRIETYTAQATLEQATGPEGGLFLPMTLPNLESRLAELLDLPFWDCVAELLNQFFPLRLRGEQLAGGLETPEPVFIRHKIAVAELWDRQTGSVQGLRDRLRRSMGAGVEAPESWPDVAVDMGLLFALYGAICRAGWLRPGDRVNLAAAAGPFTMPVAAWYARRMGLPIGEIICVCNDNGMPWELLHRGEARLDGSCRATGLPLLDIGLPCNLERLVAESLGVSSAAAYRQAAREGALFSLNAGQQATLRQGISVSVVGEKRAQPMVPRIYHTSQYLLSPYSALVYCGLGDYRSLEGEGTPALLLAEESPLRWGAETLTALGLPVENLALQITGLQRQAARNRKGD